MNARDFCFWLQGFMELTGGSIPTKAAWKLILEHLELAKLHEGESREEFEGVVSMLSGFASIAGDQKPTDEQYTRIVDIVQGVFVKVTSELDDDDEPEEESTDFSDAIKKALDEIGKNPPNPYIPPYMPYPVTPWRREDNLPDPQWPTYPQIICSNEPQTMLQEEITESLKQACETIDSLHNAKPSDSVFCGAYDSHNPLVGTCGDMYECGVEIADPHLGR